MDGSRDRYALILLGILFICIAAPRFIFPDFGHSDDYSDAFTIVSGNNFAKFGFIKLKFIPLYEVSVDKLDKVARPDIFYTHYPALSNIINGLLIMIFKTNSLYLFRAVALVVSFLGCVFWYLFIKKFSGSDILAFFCTVFYIINPLSIFAMDSMHQLAYEDLLKALVYYLFLIYAMNYTRRKGLFLSLVCACVVLSALTGFEYVVDLILFLVLFKVFIKTPKRSLTRRALFILLCMPALAFLIHFSRNIWHLGDFSSAFQDMKDIAYERVAHSKDTSIPLSFLTWWQYVVLRNFSLSFIFNYFIWAMAVFSGYLLYRNLPDENRREVSRMVRLIMLLSASGMGWYLFFPAHSLAHTFVLFLARHLVPAASVALGVFFYTWLMHIQKKGRYAFFGKTVFVIVLSLAALKGILDSQLPITPEKVAYEQDFLLFKESLLRFRDMSEPRGKVGINYFRTPTIRYYSDRQCVVTFDKASLEQLPSLPDYFIFMPYNTKDAYELSRFLEEKYSLLFQSPSKSFPAVFMKLRNKTPQAKAVEITEEKNRAKRSKAPEKSL